MTKIIKPKFLIAALLVGVCFHTAPVFAGIINIPPNFLTLNSGLVGWWTMDGKDTNWTSETAGTLADKSGNGNTGTLTGMNRATAPTIGKIGQGMNFDGVSSEIRLDNILNAPGTFTISTWVRPDVADQSNKGIVSKWDASGGYMLFMTSGKVACPINAGPHLTSNTTLSAGVWYHIVCRYDGTNAQIFINGQADSSEQAESTPFSSAASFIIGDYGDGTGLGANFKGPMDDVRVYNRALSADEIKILYTLTSGSHANVSQAVPENLNSGLVGWWTMDGKDTVWTSDTAGTVVDKSGNGNTGTLTNMNQATAPVAGKIGQGLKFDGVDDFVNAGSGTSLDDVQNQGGGGMTISLWVNPISGNIVLAKNGFNAGWWRFQLLGSGRIMFSKDGVSDLGARSSINAYVNNVWQHFTVVWDGGSTASNVRIYVNGVLKSHDLDNDGSNYFSDASLDLAIGAFTNVTNVITGSLDDVRIYNRMLSEDEIKQLYDMTSGFHTNISQAGPGNLNSGLVGWWTFDGKDTVWSSEIAGTVIDKSGNGNTGTLTNMSRSTAPVIGKIGQGLKFDTSSRVIVTNSASLNSSSITISFWAKFPDAVNVYRIIDKPSQYLVRGIGSGSIQFVGSGCGFFNSSSNKVKAGVWQHFTVTGDSSGCKWFIDGVPNTTIGTAYTGSGSSNLSISSITDPYSGSLDDIRIYNRALSISEVAQIYSLGR